MVSLRRLIHHFVLVLVPHLQLVFDHPQNFLHLADPQRPLLQLSSPLPGQEECCMLAPLNPIVNVPMDINHNERGLRVIVEQGLL